MNGDTWRKSTHSGPQANCVEVGHATGQIKVRDTKDRQGPVITLNSSTWRDFTTKLRG